MSRKVEEYFITPLEAHFESQPTEGQRETILEDFEQYSEEQLHAAVEWLKRARQSAKTFPAPKECLKAIAAAPVASEADRRARPVFTSGMTYGQKLKAWMTKLQAKSYPVIYKGTPEWTEWEIYFLATDNTVQYPVMRSKESWTVPTILPSQFDPKFDWNKGDRLLRERADFEHLSDSPQRQRFVQQELSKVRFG
jgi:hypothetical protein